jgi:hypothetical protein
MHNRRREVLEDGDDFESAVVRFTNTTLITDCYFIIGGTKANQGVVIARKQEGAAYTRRLDAQNWFLLETNYDENEQPPFYDNRRPYALAAMRQNCANGTKVDLSCMYQTLSIHPGIFTIVVVDADKLITPPRVSIESGVVVYCSRFEQRIVCRSSHMSSNARTNQSRLCHLTPNNNNIILNKSVFN